VVMAEQATTGFAGLLRQLRAEARLTQQELAKAAGVSPRSVSDLERGINRTARQDTAVRLAAALGLAEPARSLFVAAARGRIQAAQVLAAKPRQAPDDSPGSAAGVYGFVPALTSFVGRAGPVREVAALLGRERLVTVTGPGGAGKTRLAGEVAGQVAGRFADGAWLAELAPVRDPALVPAVVAAALGVREQPGLPAAGVLARVLARRQLLLVLDNCEHVAGAAAELCAGLLAACDDVRVLATSREPLRVAGEARYRLAPLALPDPDDLAEAARAESVTLFTDRVRSADAQFALTGETTPAVARLVARLDGMPHIVPLLPGERQRHIPPSPTPGIRARTAIPSRHATRVCHQPGPGHTAAKHRTPPGCCCRGTGICKNRAPKCQIVDHAGRAVSLEDLSWTTDRDLRRGGYRADEPLLRRVSTVVVPCVLGWRQITTRGGWGVRWFCRRQHTDQPIMRVPRGGPVRAGSRPVP
jgi:transcriptional regulator with XRE-family HTH domain